MASVQTLDDVIVVLRGVFMVFAPPDGMFDGCVFVVFQMSERAYRRKRFRNG